MFHFELSRRSTLGVLLSSSLLVAQAAAQPEADMSTVQACADAYEQAQVTRNAGQLVEAQKHLLLCVQDECPSFVRTDCGRWLSDIKREIPSVIFAVEDWKGDDLTDARLIVDGVPLAEGLSGKPIELNPGKHEVVVEEGGNVHRRSVVVRQAEKNRVLSIKLDSRPDTDDDGVVDSEDACPTQAGIKAERGCLPAVVAAPPVALPPAGGGDAHRTDAYIALGVGAAGLVTFAAFGYWSDKTSKDGEARCEKDYATCNPEKLIDNVENQQLVANIGAGVGAAGVVLGGVLLYLGYRADEADQVRVSVQSRDGGGVLRLGGRF